MSDSEAMKTEHKNIINSNNKGEESDAANEEINVENSENSDTSSSSSVLAGLNLVMILSSLSLSDEEGLSFDEIEDRGGGGNGDRKGKKCVSRPKVRRRQQVNEFRVSERQMSKVQPKIKDCRHCRKM